MRISERKILYCMGISLLFVMTVFPMSSLADNNPLPDNYPLEMHQEWIKNNPNELPIWLTPEELIHLDQIGRGFTPTPPPTAPVRQPAEFEPMQGVLIRYPFGVSYSIIAEMSEDIEVVTIVASQSQKNTVISQYQSHGVNLDNCDFLIAPSDTYWTRDYGPWFVIDGNGNQGIVDFIYNRPRPNDDDIPVKFGNSYGIPVYGMDLIHTGGNYMTDGHGTAVSTELVWEENPDKTHAEIDQMVHDYLGINTYHVIPDALGAYIKHIDCFAKLLSPDTIMILQVPPSNSQYDELEATVSYFENQTSYWGTPYNVVRVYAPNGEPYINSLILNNKVLVPITGSSQWDDDAIQSYQKAMPGYEVLGFTGSWYSTDALHCRTMGITDRYMLYIDHIPLHGNVVSTEEGYQVDTEIIPYSGQSLLPDQPVLYWKNDNNWNQVQMQHSGDNIYTGYIPEQIHGTEVKYYIHAEDYSGRIENHPYIGETDPHTFTALIQNPTLDADTFKISARSGGSVHFTIDAGSVNAGKNYVLLGSLSGTEPGTPLPGGLTLPLNWDALTNLIVQLFNTAMFENFQGTLDTNGHATATFNMGPLDQQFVGTKIYFAFTTYSPYSFVSNPTVIEITE